MLGYEANYDFTRYSESYNKGHLARVQNNVHEATLAYLVQGHTPYGFQLFASIGGGFMVFDPTSKGGDGMSAQLLPAFTYSLGLNHNVLSDHIGIRVQYRYVKYKTPEFPSVPARHPDAAENDGAEYRRLLSFLGLIC